MLILGLSALDPLADIAASKSGSAAAQGGLTFYSESRGGDNFSAGEVVNHLFGDAGTMSGSAKGGNDILIEGPPQWGW